MDIKKKNRISYVCVALVIIISIIYTIFSIVGGGAWLPWVLVVASLIAGPACLIAYIGELRKGVFKDDSENE